MIIVFALDLFILHMLFVSRTKVILNERFHILVSMNQSASNTFKS